MSFGSRTDSWATVSSSLSSVSSWLARSPSPVEELHSESCGRSPPKGLESQTSSISLASTASWLARSPSPVTNGLSLSDSAKISAKGSSNRERTLDSALLKADAFVPKGVPESPDAGASSIRDETSLVNRYNTRKKRSVAMKFPDPVQKDDGVEEYELEAIVDERENGDGTKDYRVKWAGYPKSENTWEPHSSVCKLDAFKEWNKKKKKKRSS